jgi:hypothetical protein
MIERGELEHPSAPPSVPSPTIVNALSEGHAQCGPKPAVQRISDQPESAPAVIQSVGAPFPGHPMGSASEQTHQQGFLFPNGGTQAGSLMMFQHAANQGHRMPQENPYAQVQGGPTHYAAADQAPAVQYTVPWQPSMTAAPGPPQWQHQVFTSPPSQPYGAAPAPQAHMQSPQPPQHHLHHQQQPPQFVVQVQPYQPVSYMVPSVVMSSSAGPHNMNLGDPSGAGGYWVVGGGGDPHQQAHQQH